MPKWVFRMEKMNFDSLDVLAAALGMIAAFSVLPAQSDRHTERIVVPLSMFFAVVLKRKIVPTLAPNPDSGFKARLTFLLTSLIGTCLLGMAFIDKFFVLGMFPNASQSFYAILLGTALLVVATVIDRRYLKTREK